MVTGSSSKSTTPAKSKNASTTPPENNEIFASEIAKRVSAVVGKEKASIVTAQVVALMSERFSGPIAHPKHLREYEEIQPGAADRIIKMAEDQLDHQQGMEKQMLSAQIRDVKEGRFYGFLALVALIAAAVLCGLNGQPLLASAFLGTGVVGTIGVFIKGKMEESD